MKLNAIMSDASASILVGTLVRLIFFPPPVLSGSGSKGRQRFSRPLSRVTFSQLPETLKGIMFLGCILNFEI
jgi:hypothetical protein